MRLLSALVGLLTAHAAVNGRLLRVPPADPPVPAVTATYAPVQAAPRWSRACEVVARKNTATVAIVSSSRGRPDVSG